MKKKILSLVLAVALCAGLAVSASAAVAAPSSTKLMVNGKQVPVDAYVIEQNNYIKLRDLATIINGTGKNFNVTFDGAKKVTKSARTSVWADFVTLL